MLWRYAGKHAVTGDLTIYSDAGDVHDEWAGSAMSWAVQNDIVRDSDGRLNLSANAARSEATTMLIRSCKNIGR